MKRLVFAALASSAALMSGTAANALTFTYTGAIDSYTVQTSGLYQIDAWGAQGGGGHNFVVQSYSGGLGAMVGGRLYLDAGETLSIVVGGMGSIAGQFPPPHGTTGGGGGGASWVYVSSDLELLLAAGGGGGSEGSVGFAVGGPGLAGRNGGGSSGGPGRSGGGMDGLGGGVGGGTTQYGFAGGGAGWLGPGDSGTPVASVWGEGGSSAPSFQGGWTLGCIPLTVPTECPDGQTGGFGGGGGANFDSGGGGGGYSGGGGVVGSLGSTGYGGGGGGSYVADAFTSAVGLSGVRSGSGLVTIDPVPEPTTWAIILLGLGGLGVALRIKRRNTAPAIEAG